MKKLTAKVTAVFANNILCNIGEPLTLQVPTHHFKTLPTTGQIAEITTDGVLCQRAFGDKMSNYLNLDKLDEDGNLDQADSIEKIVLKAPNFKAMAYQRPADEQAHADQAAASLTEQAASIDSETVPYDG